MSEKSLNIRCYSIFDLSKNPTNPFVQIKFTQTVKNELSSYLD